MRELGKDYPESNDGSKRVGRRGLLLGLGAIGVVGTALTVASVFDIESWFDKTGQQRRELEWSSPQSVFDEGIEWVEYSGDPNVDDDERTWKKVAGLVVPKAEYDDFVKSTEDLQPAFVFMSGNYTGVGVAFEGQDPMFLGETNSRKSYLLAAKIGPDDTEMLIGGYTRAKSEFIGFETKGLPAQGLEEFLKEEQYANWV